MKRTVDEYLSVLDRLTQRVEELEARLSALERQSRPSRSAEEPVSTFAVPPLPLEQIALPRPTGVLASIGKIFLGIAGAYLLRALAESGVVPQMAIVIVAIAYAAGWLVWAARVRTAGVFPAAAYAATASLILSPMLWELTVRFKILPSWIAAFVLAGFLCLASALAWKDNLRFMVAITSAAAAVTCLFLLVATRDPVPFVIALLTMGAVIEVAASRDRWLGSRWIVGLASDFALLALILVYTREGGAPAEYRPIASPILLLLLISGFAIYAAGLIDRAVIVGRRISIFETAQNIAVFLLATAGALRVNSGDGPEVGVFCLVAGAFCYLVAFLSFKRMPQGRNYHVFGIWAVVLLLAGSFLFFPVQLLTVCLALAAVLAAGAGLQWRHMTLVFHAAAFLAAMIFVAGVLQFGADVLAGALPASAGWRIWIAATATVICYVLATRWPVQDETWKERLLRLIFAVPGVYVLTTLAVIFFARLFSIAGALNDPLLAVIRTFIVCVAALGLALAGSRWRRIELVWLAYAAIVLCTVKLLLEDLQHGHAGYVAASLFFCGAAWIVVPRMAKKTAR